MGRMRIQDIADDQGIDEQGDESPDVTITIPKPVFAGILVPIVDAVLKALDLESVARAAAMAVETRRMTTAKSFPAREVAQMLGITMLTLKNRRLLGHIKGFKRPGERAYHFTREEVERVLGRPVV